MSDDENWRAIEGYLGYYEVSNLGRVRSLPRSLRRTDGVLVRRRGKILSLATTPDGYRQVLLSKHGIKELKVVHVLVLIAFVGPRPPGAVGCHGDNGPADDSVENLQWGPRRIGAAS